MKALLLLLSLLLCTNGCMMQGVPATKFSIVDPVTGVKMNYEGPKQVRIGALRTTYSAPGGPTASVQIENLSAENEPSVIQQAGSADAQRIMATSGLVKQIGDTVGQAAAAAATKAVAP